MFQIFFLVLKFQVIATKNGAAVLSKTERFCQTGNSIITYVAELFQSAFLYSDIPEWVEQSFIIADCSKKGLNFIPTQLISSNTEFLDMSYNELRIISSNDFVGLENLMILNFDLNCVKTWTYTDPHANCRKDLYIEPGAFKYLKKLRFLLLRFNFLRDFPRELPVSLQYLSIMTTYLGDITTQLIESGSNLKGLAAGFNCVSQDGLQILCPREFNITANFSNVLEMLYLEVNSWFGVPSYFISKKLRDLDLSFNPILEIRKTDFVRGKNLKVLALEAISSPNNPLKLAMGSFDFLVQLEVLILCHNYLTYIPNNLFRHTANLKVLDLSKNNLFQTIFNPTYLINLKFLTYLNVAENTLSIKNVHFHELVLGSSFANLTSLQSLYIGLQPMYSSVQFDSISEDSISLLASMINLKTLSVAGLSLTKLNPTCLRKLTNIKSFDASSNNIRFQSLKSSLILNETRKQNLPHLNHCCKNKYLPRLKPNENLYAKHLMGKYDVQDECMLSILNLSNNVILSLKGHLMFLDKACVVDLSNNKISQISSTDFKSFQNLQMLLLDHNPLHFVDPSALLTLVNLKILSFNDIQLDAEISYNPLLFLYNLSNLTSISFRWKDVEGVVSSAVFQWSIATNSTSIKSISKLDLSGNKITLHLNITTFVFQQTSSMILRSCQILDSMMTLPMLPAGNILEILDLGDNEMSELPTEALKNQKNLVSLALDYNRISMLSGDFLLHLTSLRKLVISHNKISHIQPGFFSGSKLEYLDLSYNKIARLNDEVLTLNVLKALFYIDIRKNEFDCSCGVWDTYRIWLMTPQSQEATIPGLISKCTLDIDLFYDGCVDCQSPYKLRGLSLLWYITHPSCKISAMSSYTAFFSAFFLVFLVFGTLGYSKWVKRVVFRKVNQQFRVRSLQPKANNRSNDPKQLQNVFIVFDLQNSEVADWVDHRLCQAMSDGNHPISLIIHGKHNSCGVAPSQQALRNIMNCQKTVLLLSYDFCLERTCR